MSNEPTSIDALLSAPSTGNQPNAPENLFGSGEEAPAGRDEAPQIESEATPYESMDPDISEDSEASNVPVEMDDYGNERAPSKTFTEEEVNERINKAMRERFSRERQQPNQSQIQQATQQGFEYNAESTESWQQQLEGFVEQTFHKIGQKQAQQEQEMREKQADAEFHTKFQEGMKRFPDFYEVVGKQPFTDAMTHALRSFDDPSAFAIAAAKRAPKELEKIAAYRDPVKQMVELGKLEERMRQSKPMTKTPKPLGKMQEDSPIPHKNTREPSIEELIAKDAAKRQAAQNRHKRN